MVPAGSAEGQRFAFFDLIAFGPHFFQKIIIALAVGEYPVNGLPQLLLVAGSILFSRHLFLLSGAGPRVFNHGEAVRPAQLIIEPPQDKGGLPHIPEFTVTVEVGAVNLDMRMDMGFVHMGGNNELVLALCILHRQLIADAVCFFRTDLSRLKGLDDAVHQHIPALGLAAPGDLGI